jgi:hypothetical protein
MDGDHITRETDNTLDKTTFLIQWKVKDNNLPPIGVCPTICETVDNHELTIMQTWFHTASFNTDSGSDQINCQE